jgi:hypothetical protein
MLARAYSWRFFRNHVQDYVVCIQRQIFFFAPFTLHRKELRAGPGGFTGFGKRFSGWHVPPSPLVAG